ncbi:peroxiredoxin [Halobacillus salinus]|uniref:Peroxiredoxin n=1 Tax=Halobacillus salinus TaxID=192814 RepID=A0A4Z0H3T8_9BACI|nr:peroxiredoxin [Halobacillus salinus]TGB05088.1 peroxiredoxin [Halobacillus salinus]
MTERMVAKQAPRFEMEAVLPNEEYGKVSLEKNISKDKWTVLFFYPMDLSFVSPTEITELSDRIEEFSELNTEVIGISTDTIHAHRTFIATPRGENGLGDLQFPLAADTNHHVSKSYGVLIEEEGVALRGLFIVNPEGELEYQVVHHKNLGRNVDETVRILKALQEDDPHPLSWKVGQQTL